MNLIPVYKAIEKAGGEDTEIHLEFNDGEVEVIAFTMVNGKRLGACMSCGVLVVDDFILKTRVGGLEKSMVSSLERELNV